MWRAVEYEERGGVIGFIGYTGKNLLIHTCMHAYATHIVQLVRTTDIATKQTDQVCRQTSTWIHNLCMQQQHERNYSLLVLYSIAVFFKPRQMLIYLPGGSKYFTISCLP